ncbi:hypothetical protein F5Y10DRAFT_197783 [Nemania abortiva]|nr:hypothetical protein F5Y10DRAFT_197783 [Nemania abortiva]
MEVVGGISAVASLSQQSVQLLDRIVMALNKQKSHSMHLSTVMRDVEGTKSIVERVQNNPLLQHESLEGYLDDLLKVSNELGTLVTSQDAMTAKGRGFRLFVHDFVNGPKEQQELEQLRNSLTASKNSLTLALVAGLSPAGTTLSLTNVKLTDRAYQQNSRILRGPDDKEFDNMILKNIDQSGTSVLYNSSMTPDELNKVTAEQNKRFRLEHLTGLLKSESVAAEMKQQILNSIMDLSK